MSILVVDDNEAERELAERILVAQNHNVTATSNIADAAAILKQHRHDVLITDIDAPGLNAMELLRETRDNYADTGVIVLSGHPSVDSAFEAARRGALAYLRKPLQPDDLRKAVSTAGVTVQGRRLVTSREPHSRSGPGVRWGAVGESPLMLHVFQMISKIAETDADVLLQGETGSGKELLAQAIHQASRRSGAPFVGVNCTAIPRDLIESELFGHVRGSFTGASANHRGYFAQANGGTILLDEIGEMHIDLQPKLLRVLESRCVRPVGGERDEPVNVRVIAATNRHLAEALDGKGFRRDLYYRLRVAEIDIPPLRDRGADILLLTRYFLDSYSREYQRPPPRLTDAAIDALLHYDWPGNVRELKYLVKRIFLTSDRDTIDVTDLHGDFRSRVRPEGFLGLTLEEVTQRARYAHVQRVLASVGGNRRKAAAKLGVTPRTVRRLLNADTTTVDAGLIEGIPD